MCNGIFFFSVSSARVLMGVGDVLTRAYSWRRIGAYLYGYAQHAVLRGGGWCAGLAVEEEWGGGVLYRGAGRACTNSKILT